jgi:uncharacterized membrane protein
MRGTQQQKIRAVMNGSYANMVTEDVNKRLRTSAIGLIGGIVLGAVSGQNAIVTGLIGGVIGYVVGHKPSGE